MSVLMTNETSGDLRQRLELKETKQGLELSCLLEQNCDDLLARCKAARIEDKLRGFRRPGVFRCVAELPLALVELLQEQGMDILRDKEALRRVLNDPAFKAFRTTEGKV